jgi:hypothetical protein
MTTITARHETGITVLTSDRYVVEEVLHACLTTGARFTMVPITGGWFAMRTDLGDWRTLPISGETIMVGALDGPGSLACSPGRKETIGRPT